MTRYAILSDIHANIEALRAVLDELNERNIDEILFLGDIVGYGPDPVACIQELLEQYTWPVQAIRGNNDQTVLTMEGPGSQADYLLLLKTANLQSASDVTRGIRITELNHLWTQQQVKADPSAWALLEQKLVPANTPYLIDQTILLVHASPCEPIGMQGNYLRTAADAEEAFVCQEDFHVGFFGHTHHASIFRQTTTQRLYDNVEHIPCSHSKPTPMVVTLDEQRVLINPGSVGQPRDGNQQAAYAIYDTTGKGSVEFYRVAYNVATTIKKLEALREAPQWRSDPYWSDMLDTLIGRLQEAS